MKIGYIPCNKSYIKGHSNDVWERCVRNDVWELVPRPKDTQMIDTKWIFKNKTNKDGEVVRNKSRLVA